MKTESKHQVDFSSSFTLREVRKNKFYQLLFKSISSSLAISELWSMQQNVVERSVQAVSVSLPSSKVLCHFSAISER